MRMVIQEVLSSSVNIDNKEVASINRGELVLVGFTFSDNEKLIDKMIDKLLKLRIFPDENGKTNLSVKDIDGEILSVSQFTLYANCVKGNRPSFTQALSPSEADKLFEYYKYKLSNLYPKVKFGIFQTDMKVNLINDGPFTLILDSKELFNE